MATSAPAGASDPSARLFRRRPSEHAAGVLGAGISCGLGCKQSKKPKKRQIQMTDGCVGFCSSLSNSLFGCKERAKGALAFHG